MVDVALKDVFALSKKIGKIPFSEVLKSSCGYKIIPFDQNIPEDAELLKHLTYALNNFLKLTKKSKSRYMGQRINDVGKQIEDQIVQEIKRAPFEVNKLGESGYPDFEIKQNGKIIAYLELKTTGNIKKSETHHRMFYFTSGKKISSDAKHFLLQIQMEEEVNKYWKVVSWQLRDFSKLNVRLKTEFNANFGDFEKTPLLKSG